MSYRDYAQSLRLQAVVLRKAGKTVAQIAVIVQRSERAVYGWFKKANERGEEALQRQPGTGKSLDLTKEQRSKLSTALERKPKEAGIKGPVWSSGTFAKLVTKVTGKPCNRYMAFRMLTALGYSFEPQARDYSGRRPNRKYIWIKSVRH
jgi:transposase